LIIFFNNSTNSLSRIGKKEIYCPPHDAEIRVGESARAGEGTNGELYLIIVVYSYLHCKKCGTDYDYVVHKTTVVRVR